MEVKKPTVRELIVDRNKTFVIPPYQRGYNWKQERWQSLVSDIAGKATSPIQDKLHWMGIVLTTPSQAQFPIQGYHDTYYDLIDGQQRIMTLRTWLQAVLDHARDNEIKLSSDRLEFSQIICQEQDKQEFEDILTENRWRQKWRTYKGSESGLLHCYTYFRWILWLGDSALLEAEPSPLPAKPMSSNQRELEIEEQWQLALSRRASLSDIDEIENSNIHTSRSKQLACDDLIKATLNQLSFIELIRQESIDEDPAEIFQALNGEREPLDQYDHVRNEIFSSIKTPKERIDFYENKWKSHDNALKESGVTAKGSVPGDTFLYDFLIAIGERKYQSISKTKTATHFSRYVRYRGKQDYVYIAEKSLLPNLVAWITVKRNGESFNVGNEIFQLNPEIKSHLVIMEALSSGPMLPILMSLVRRFFEGEINDNSLKRQVFLLESFLGRRVLSRTGLSSLRSEMMNFAGQLSRNFTEDELRDSLIKIAPADEEIQEVLLPRMINKIKKYDELAFVAHKKGVQPRQLLAIFQAIENKRSTKLGVNLLKPSTNEDRFSVEHVFPQNHVHWREELRKWNVAPSFMENRLHTLGNVAIIPSRLNSELLNQSFKNKMLIIRDPETRFPKLSVNAYWTRDAQTKWTPEDIDRRAEQLVTDALSYWKLG